MVSGIATLAYGVEVDAVLLMVTAKFLGHRTTSLRVTLAATVGVLPTLWVLLRQDLYAVPWELGLLWPLVMLAIAFHGLPKRFWLKSYVVFLAASLLLGGGLAAGLAWLRLVMPGAPDWGWLFFVPPLILVGARWLPTARVRQLVGREHYGEVRLHLGSRVLTLPVLWDSGNQLTDHRLGRPVVIVDTTRARDWLTPALAAWVEAVHQKHDGSVPSEWQGRTAVVPFRTIAGPGELPVVAVDRAQGRYGDRWYPMAPVMVGLLREPIAADGSYAALADPKSLIRCPNERVGA